MPQRGHDPRTTWTSADIGDLAGRTYIVTGATSGIGAETALALAGHGALVVVTGRNPDKLRAIAGRAAGVATGPPPSAVELDLADLSSVRRAADEILVRHPTVHVLVANAGVMASPRTTTADGFELQIGTNHLGHFALIGLLLRALPVADPDADARVVVVSSGMHRSGSVVPDDLNFERRRYQPWLAYGQSKLANLLFMAELDRRARAADKALKSVAAHPGWAATNLQTAGPAMGQNVVGRSAIRLANAVVGQSAEAGAWPTLYAATDPSVASGEYFGPSRFELRGHPQRVGRSGAARDEATAAALWTVSEELTGVRFPW